MGHFAAAELELHAHLVPPVEKTFAWQVQYMEGLGDHFAYSLSYLNQGHFISHHRDANAANLWVRTNLFDRQLSLAAGG
jgi:hypothetical protein